MPFRQILEVTKSPYFIKLVYMVIVIRVPQNPNGTGHVICNKIVKGYRKLSFVQIILVFIKAPNEHQV